jgi:hypothetical protein
VSEIFDYWRKRMDSPRSRLDDKRRKLIRHALKTYTPAELCVAIRGCSRSPWHMGQNDRNRKFNGIELILRSAEKIDQFIGFDVQPPAPAYADAEARKSAQSDANGAAWLHARGHASDPDAIDVEVHH